MYMGVYMCVTTELETFKEKEIRKGERETKRKRSLQKKGWDVKKKKNVGKKENQKEHNEKKNEREKDVSFTCTHRERKKKREYAL